MTELTTAESCKEWVRAPCRATTVDWRTSLEGHDNST